MSISRVKICIKFYKNIDLISNNEHNKFMLRENTKQKIVYKMKMVAPKKLQKFLRMACIIEGHTINLERCRLHAKNNAIYTARICIFLYGNIIIIIYYTCL